MIQDFIDVVSEWIQGIISFIVSAFEGIIGIFYDNSAEGEGFTVLGMLLLFGLAVSFVGMAITFIRRLIQK